MTRAGAAALGVPARARAAYDRLIVAAQREGPTPCSVNPSAWTDEPDQFDAAARACTGCPVFVACNQYALSAGEKSGVWGGNTPARRGRPAKKGTAA